jgi:hypothetical protein
MVLAYMRFILTTLYIGFPTGNLPIKAIKKPRRFAGLN